MSDTYDAVERGAYFGSLSSLGPTGLGYDMGNGCATAVAWVEQRLGAYLPCPVHWFALGAPGPIWEVNPNDRRYCFDWPLHCRRDNVRAGVPGAPSWRVNPAAGVTADLVDRSPVVDTWPLWREMADRLGLRYLQYTGMLTHEDLVTLAGQSLDGLRNRVFEAYDWFWRVLRADAIAIDVAVHFGGYNRPSNVPTQQVWDRFETVWSELVATSLANPTAPMIAAEPYVQTAVQGSTPRLPNRLTTAMPWYLNHNDFWLHLPPPLGQNSTDQAPTPRFFAADFIGPNPALRRTPAEERAINAQGGVLLHAVNDAFPATAALFGTRASVANPILNRSPLRDARVAPRARGGFRLPGR
jgi:hypothetical protein